MNTTEKILFPFVLIYKGFISVLLSPYYLVLGFVKLFEFIFSSKNKQPKVKKDKILKEAKKNNEEIVVREKRSAYQEPEVPKKETNPEVLKIEKSNRTKKQQREFERLVAKAREDEKKRVVEIERAKQERDKKEKERVARELSADQHEQSQIIAAQKKLEADKKAGKVPFSIKFSEWFSKINTPANQALELEARQTVMKEGFKEKVKKDENLKPMLFTYIAKNRNGKLETSDIEALTRMDVQSFLLTEGYEVYDIYLSKKKSLGSSGTRKLKKSRLIFYLSQLSAYLKSGIALAEAVKILYEQSKKINEKAAWKAVYYDLAMGDILSTAMEKRGTAFPKLLINMIKTAEMTGNLPETLDDMVEYYTESEQTRKQMKSAMTYPVLILSFALIVVTFILIWVIPQFEDIFADLGAELPTITKVVVTISKFLKNYILYLLIGLIVILLIYLYMYKNIKSFRKLMQEFSMHLPIFGNIIIYNEITIFTKTFANLINHNVFITDSMDVLSKITNNEIYKKLIYDTANNLNKGETISAAFKNQWVFPNIAYQMLLTGEKTGRLGPMMERVSDYYDEQHRSIINQMKTLIEPILIFSLAVIVGFILLAVIVPMFEMYNAL